MLGAVTKMVNVWEMRDTVELRVKMIDMAIIWNWEISKHQFDRREDPGREADMANHADVEDERRCTLLGKALSDGSNVYEAGRIWTIW